MPRRTSWEILDTFVGEARNPLIDSQVETAKDSFRRRFYSLRGLEIRTFRRNVKAGAATVGLVLVVARRRLTGIAAQVEAA
jgi:hypothetical protein